MRGLTAIKKLVTKTFPRGLSICNHPLGEYRKQDSVESFFHFIRSTWPVHGCTDSEEAGVVYSGRTKYSAFVSKLSKFSEKYLSLQKTQKAAVFFNQKIFGRTMI